MTPSLDHIGMLVPNLAVAAGVATALGFTLTPPVGFERRAPDGTALSPNSAQQTIMFAQGYLELQQLFDLDGDHPLAPAGRRYMGAHIVAFGVADAAADHAEAGRQALQVGALQRWSRSVDHPDGPTEAAFLFYGAPYRDEEAYLCWVQHLTPHTLRHDALVRHANGAIALTGITIVTEGDLTPLVARYLNAGAVVGEHLPDRCVLQAGPMAITLRHAAREAFWPADRWIERIDIAVRDLDPIRNAAVAHGIECQERPGGLTLDLSAAWGVRLGVSAI